MKTLRYGGGTSGGESWGHQGRGGGNQSVVAQGGVAARGSGAVCHLSGSAVWHLEGVGGI